MYIKSEQERASETISVVSDDLLLGVIFSLFLPGDSNANEWRSSVSRHCKAKNYSDLIKMMTIK